MSKIANGRVLFSLLMALSLGVVYAELGAGNNNTLLGNNTSINESVNKTLNESINKTLNESINETEEAINETEEADEKD
ncbi:Uncharacterised protein [uncultured archaeon]|nr:Uncharacterised protein [uncultured archaeon]